MSGRPEELGPVYYRVSPAFWMNRTWTDDMRILGLYLLTSPHRSLEGLFWLPKQYILGDLKWSPERLSKPFGQLTADGFLKYDDAGEVALIVKALKYQKLPNPNMRTAALRRVQTVPQTRIDEPFLASCDEYCEPFAELLRERLPQRFGEPSPVLVLNLSPSNPLADDAPAPPADPPVGKITSANFEAFWSHYPRKERKTECAKRFDGLTKNDQAAAAYGARHLAVHVLATNTELEYIPLPSTFIGPKRIFEDWKNGPPAAHRGDSAAKRLRCPNDEMDLTYDEDGQHCPVCGWRPSLDHQEATAP